MVRADIAARRIGLALLLLVAGCSTLPQSPARLPTGPQVDSPFALAGRMSVRRGSEAWSGSFEWTHAPPGDALRIGAPLGQTIATLDGNSDARRVSITHADGRVDEGPDWSTLSARALGYPLPVADLAFWIRGVPSTGAPTAVESDAAGRTSVLRQDGWAIVYGYPDGSSPRPSRLRIEYPELEIRIVVDRWD